MKIIQILALAPLALACGPKSLTVLSTNDVHGAWFDSSYVDGSVRPSLFAVNSLVDSVRRADGAGNVLLLDAGDCLQGDNAAYYFNYVDTVGEHLFSRIAAYMKYDAVCLGNHDIETGHRVYDRLVRELGSHRIPFMSGNAVRDNGQPYFPLYKVFRRGGFKVLVLGYNNANIAAWLDRSLWSGMRFRSLIPLVQKDVDALMAVIKPDVTIVCVHSGAGKGDGSILEDQALDLFKSLKGVDLLLCAHDHRQLALNGDGIALLNAGSRARWLGQAKIRLEGKGAKNITAQLLKVDAAKADTAMRSFFRPDYNKVKAFTLKEIGLLTTELVTRKAFIGTCPYMQLIHKLQLQASGAQISFAAPLTFDGRVKAGVLRNNDLFTIYPYENQLFTLRLKGSEIKRYLEYSYGLWLAAPGSGHALAIRQRGDPRYAQANWSFVNPSFNFDSAAGIVYTVDLEKPEGSRVKILRLADGSRFDPEAEYTVAMTSYRANGGGDLLIKGAGIPKEELASRVNGRYPEIRECLREFILANGALDPSLFSGPELGGWEFIHKQEQLLSDYRLLFGK